MVGADFAPGRKLGVASGIELVAGPSYCFEVGRRGGSGRGPRQDATAGRRSASHRPPLETTLGASAARDLWLARDPLLDGKFVSRRLGQAWPRSRTSPRGPRWAWCGVDADEPRPAHPEPACPGVTSPIPVELSRLRGSPTALLLRAEAVFRPSGCWGSGHRRRRFSNTVTAGVLRAIRASHQARLSLPPISSSWREILCECPRRPPSPAAPSGWACAGPSGTLWTSRLLRDGPASLPSSPRASWSFAIAFLVTWAGLPPPTPPCGSLRLCLPPSHPRWT